MEESVTEPERMPPIALPVEVDIHLEFRDGLVNIDVASPDGEEAPLTRIELTSLLSVAIMSIGYSACLSDIEE